MSSLECDQDRFHRVSHGQRLAVQQNDLERAGPFVADQVGLKTQGRQGGIPHQKASERLYGMDFEAITTPHAEGETVQNHTAI